MSSQDESPRFENSSSASSVSGHADEQGSEGHNQEMRAEKMEGNTSNRISASEDSNAYFTPNNEEDGAPKPRFKTIRNRNMAANPGASGA